MLSFNIDTENIASRAMKGTIVIVKALRLNLRMLLAIMFVVFQVFWCLNCTPQKSGAVEKIEKLRSASVWLQTVHQCFNSDSEINNLWWAGPVPTERRCSCMYISYGHIQPLSVLQWHYIGELAIVCRRRSVACSSPYSRKRQYCIRRRIQGAQPWCWVDDWVLFSRKRSPSWTQSTIDLFVCSML